jgi:hypothetical protein
MWGRLVTCRRLKIGQRKFAYAPVKGRFSIGSRIPSCSTKAVIFVCLPTLCFAAPSYTDVAKIFSERCLGCHAATVKMGTLNLETYDGLQQGGTHTTLVVPGKSADSRLYLLITGKAMPAMPMDGGKLTP